MIDTPFGTVDLGDPAWWKWLYYLLLGLAAGSFLNVVIYRLPRGLSLNHPPSACPKCGAPILWFDNIPVVSFLNLGGKCRHCKAGISRRYPAIEALTAAMFLAVYFGMPLLNDYEKAYYIAFAVLCIAVFFIDAEFFIIPDALTYPGFALGVVGRVFFYPQWGSALDALAGAAVFAGTLALMLVAGSILFKREAMGWGDVKYGLAAGAFLGLRPAMAGLMLSVVIGAVVSIGLTLVRGKFKRYQEIPFGPYLVVGSILSVIFGESLLAWYLSFFRP